jgi:hypothetical protein
MSDKSNIHGLFSVSNLYWKVGQVGHFSRHQKCIPFPAPLPAAREARIDAPLRAALFNADAPLPAAVFNACLSQSHDKPAPTPPRANSLTKAVCNEIGPV